MNLFVNTLYSIFLGMMFRSLLHIRVQEGAGTNCVAVKCLLDVGNVMHTLPLMVLFLIDWVCFQAVFPISSDVKYSFWDGIMLVVYTPSLAFLGYGVVTSLEKSERYSGSVALYHFLAASGEVVWITTLFFRTDGDMNTHQVGLVFFLVFLYVILRYALVVVHSLIYFGKLGNIQPQILVVTAWLFKPTLLILLFKIVDRLQV